MRRWNRLGLLLAIPLAIAGCTGDDGAQGPPGDPGDPGDLGDPGAPCTVVDNDDGTFTMTCPDSDPVTFGSDEEPAEFVAADAANGGAMYDKFWAVDGVTAAQPTTDHALYPSFGAKSGADTWRCKECHGWDYIGRDGRYKSGSHYTGIRGLYPPTESLWTAFIAIGEGHGYSAAGLTDGEIWDLVKFYREGMLDISTILADDGGFLGSASAGAGLYDDGMPGFNSTGTTTNSACMTCHGPDGTADNPGAGAGFVEFPGLLSNDNPQEFQHKVRFGHPGTAMPASAEINGSLQDVADVSAYSQTLSPVLWSDVDVARGGQLYDKWWVVNGATEPTTTHNMYPEFGAKSLSTTWRCKECHGWDYIGADGRYSSGSHYTGIAGLFPPMLTKWQAFEEIKDGHGMGAAGLADADVWDLVGFYGAGQADYSFILKPDGTFNGNAATGATLFNSGIGGGTACATCHDADGLADNPGGGAGFTDFPGMLSWDNPQEYVHKSRFGHPGTAMVVTYDFGSTLSDIGDLSAHSQTLPCAPGPVCWDPVADACTAACP